MVGRGTMPMPLTGGRADGVTRADLDDIPAARLDATDALGYMDRLTNRVDVPCVAGAGREPNDGDSDPRWLLAAGDDVQPGVADEPVSRGFLGRRLAHEVHCALPSGFTMTFAAIMLVPSRDRRGDHGHE
jgi:hypothetical protein